MSTILCSSEITKFRLPGEVRFWALFLLNLAFGLAASSSAADAEFTAPDLDFFEKKVRPLLAEHCYECHSTQSEKLQAGLLLDSRTAILEGGESGVSMVPGDADASLIVEAVRYESYEMPPNGKLPDADIETFEQWVEMGAPWPTEAAPTRAESRPRFDLDARSEEHWVWQPIQNVTPPAVADLAWPRDPIDQFILASLERADLHPAADTDRNSLLRRLHFDLIGLPPTPEQAAAFMDNESPLAVEQLVDELLDSPHFGERWARHWLDLVRYAESRGHEFDDDTLNAFQYRDYVIRALNADVPYDQFVREHIAGDLLPSPRLNSQTGGNESILGTGFWFLGEWVHSPVDTRKDESDRFDNMIDVMSKTFLSVTVACARCHDHKFDAISTADYYSLSGFLQSSDYRQVRFESIEHNRQIASQLAELDARYCDQITSKVEGASTRVIEPTSARSEQAAAAIVVDYAKLPSRDFIQDGFVFGDHARRAGEVYLSHQDGKPTISLQREAAAVSDPFWQDLESVNGPVISNRSSLSKFPSSGRTLRTPTFEVKHGNVAIRANGSGSVFACVDSHRLVAGPLHGQVIGKINEKQRWVELDLRRYVGHHIHLEFTPGDNTQLAVSLITDGATAEVRKEIDERAAELAAAITEHEQKIQQASEQVQPMLMAWSQQRADLASRMMRRSHVAIAMLDGSSEDDRILIRGNSGKPGELEPRHFLTAISGNRALPIPVGSGRLQLAAEINAADNPLTRRVIVNRVWHYLMGRGIVPTTDDFGVLGERPTHPELLDYLATEFAHDGQSLKRLVRRIVLSRTYQMSSEFDAAVVLIDPKNLLWHHRPIKRLDGETIRDSLLVLAGRLDQTMYGPSVPVYLTSFMDGRGRPGSGGPIDGAGRRSIYGAVRRNFLSPFMTTFDSPTPFSTMGRRNVSNVPAQALILMNDPLVVDLARSWAARAIEHASETNERIEWLFHSALGRTATEQERDTAAAYIEMQSASLGVDANSLDVWSDLAHALINTKEFIYIP